MAKDKHIRFDWAMKRLLRQKSNFGILEGFLSELLMQDIKILEIIDSESNKLHENDKSNRVDILVKSTNDELMLIEVQNEREHDYFHRMNYGQAKLTTEHISAGDFYDKIKKVYSINIVYFELGQGQDYVYIGKTQFKGIHKKDILNLSKSQKKAYTNIKEVSDIFATYYIIKVNNFDKVAENSLDEWIYFLKNSEIKEEFKAKGLQEAKEKMRTDNLESAEKADYEAYVKEQRIKGAEFFSARIDGILESEQKFMPIIKQKEQEIEQERQKFEQKEKELQKEKENFKIMVQNLNKRGHSPLEIAEITGQSIEKIKKIIERF